MADILLAELLAQDLGERIVDSLEEVGHLKLRSIELEGCSQTAQMGHAESMATAYQIELRRHRVDTVHHIIILSKVYLVRPRREVEHRQFVHLALGIDGMDTLLGHIDLRASHRGKGGEQLAVDIGHTDTVVVNHVDGTHTAPGQHIDDITAHAAHAKDCYSTGSERLEGRTAQKKLRS